MESMFVKNKKLKNDCTKIYILKAEERMDAEKKLYHWT